MSTPIVEFNQVTFTYDGHRFALNDIDLTVEPGEFLCVLGGNGSGKSTLARHINALLIPDEGQVMVDGQVTSQSDVQYLVRSTAGMVFQNPDDQLVATLVEDDVAFGPENLGIPMPELEERVHAALERVGLTGFEKRETHALSGGQKQRVAIAGVLAMEPRILILDEASAMLDPRGRNSLLRTCRELHAEGMTIILITHFMEEAAAADRVVVLEEGKVALAGTPSEVFSQVDRLVELNLEIPFASSASRLLQRSGWDVPVCTTEDELVECVAAACGERAFDMQGHAPFVEAPSIFADEPVLSVQGVSYTYDAAKENGGGLFAKKKEAAPVHEWGGGPDDAWALQDVTFDVYPCEFFGIAGHTGSGKSTLIQHLNGLLHPAAGRVLVQGEDISSKAAAAKARSVVGVVFQYPEHQLFAPTVYEDVAFGPRNLGLSEPEVAKRVAQALERVGLDFKSMRDRSPFQLSGGQQRRVAFAGVLAMDPQVLVLDEPAASLDPVSRKRFMRLIKGLHEEGLTVVMVSHNMEDLAVLCDRVAILDKGRVAMVGAPEEVFQNESDLKAMGLGVPAAQRVANRLVAEGVMLTDAPLLTEHALVRALSAVRPRA